MPGFCLFTGALTLAMPQTCGPRWSQGRAPFHPILEAVGSLDTNPQAQSDYGTGVGLDLISALVNEWWQFFLKNELLPSQRKNTKSEARIKIHHPIDPQLKCRLRCSLRCSLWPTSHAMGWTVLFTTAWNHQHFHFHVLRPACPTKATRHISLDIVQRLKWKMMKHAYGDAKQLRRSQGQDGKLQLKNLASSESSEISMAVAAVGMFLWCLLIRWRKYFSAAWESDFTSLFLERSFLVTDCRKAAPRHLEVWTWDTHNPWS